MWDWVAGLATLIADGTTAFTAVPGGGPLTETTSAGTATLLADGLGSVRATTDNTGTVTATADYGPYGIPDGDISAFGFAGQTTDTTGLQHLRARAYNPTLGRFMSPDTIVPDPNRAGDYNRYTYA